MKIEVFTLCWNEIAILPFAVDYWRRFASRVTVYDNGVAEFYFDDEGCIGWKDEIENAGEGLQFNATNG